MKRIAELRDLSDDHHAALVLARRCVRSPGAGTPIAVDAVWRELRVAFEEQLEPHFRIEEQHLLPALESIGEPGLSHRIREDHAVLRALAGAAAPGEAAIERFGRLLESHVRFEEREAFEIAQSRLPAAALRAIADACRIARCGRPTSSGQSGGAFPGTSHALHARDTNASEAGMDPTSPPSDRPTAATPGGRWLVWRCDDHGNRFEVSRGHTEEEARRLVEELERRGHRQSYGAEPEP